MVACKQNESVSAKCYQHPAMLGDDSSIGSNVGKVREENSKGGLIVLCGTTPYKGHVNIATELETRGCNINDELWSAKALTST